ncbi:MAG: HAD-IA family hydrolase [Candidatus Aenigmarchaeota archaeon]|nr:HAD-IA family hydrolase [Candidatus Aenigmarchaeota archaeon]
MENHPTKTKPKIKAVVFDMHGVVLKIDLGQWYRYVPYYAYLISDKLAKILGEHETPAHKQEKLDRHLKCYNGWDRLDTGVAEIIKSLKSANYVTVALSNMPTDHADTNRMLGYYDNFDYTILSSEVGHSKPDRRIFNKVEKVTGIRPENCLYFDDFFVNILAARAYGFNAELYTHLFDSPKKMRAVLDRYGVKF